MDQLRRWILDERITVAALLESLTAVALDDAELRAKVAPAALAIINARGARR
jgi:hypothetical protein